MYLYNITPIKNGDKEENMELKFAKMSTQLEFVYKSGYCLGMIKMCLNNSLIWHEEAITS